MTRRPWVPRPTEIIRIDFSPIRGHEQANDRPAIMLLNVVLSNQGFNDKTGLVVCVPCTTQIKGNPFEVRLSALNKPGAALAHHLRTMDWRERGAISLGFATPAEMLELRGKVQALLELG